MPVPLAELVEQPAAGEQKPHRRFAKWVALVLGVLVVLAGAPGMAATGGPPAVTLSRPMMPMSMVT